jgi:hypothetical protein
MKKFIVAVSSIVLGSASTWGGNQGADATVLVANLANENKIITALSDSNGDNAFVSLGRDRIQDNSYGSGGRIARTRRWWPKGRYYVDKFRNKKLTRPWRINLDESNISMPACKNIRARYQWDSDNNTWGCN